MEDTKICSKCGRELPLSEFSKHKRSKDGLQPYCKECKKECNKQYYAENREKITELRKQWYDENREELLEYWKQYRAENREKIKQYRQENREYWKQYQKQYYSTLRGYCTNIRKTNIHADKKYGRIGDELPPNYPTIEDYMELLQQRDFYDGKQYDFTEMGLDRIDNDKPHTLDNIVPCTTKHNVERQKIPFDVFKQKIIDMNNAIYSPSNEL